LLESENLVYGATAGTKIPLSMIQLCLNYFSASFFKTLGIHFSRWAKERDAPVVVALVFLFVYADNHPSFLIFRFPFRTPGRMTHTRKPKNSSNHLSPKHAKILAPDSGERFLP